MYRTMTIMTGMISLQGYLETYMSNSTPTKAFESYAYPMNHNHFNPELTYSLKVKRVTAILEDLKQAEAILRQLPEDAVQSIWSKVALHKLPPKSAKGKAASKGVYKRSLRKTIEALITQQQLICEDTRERLQEIDRAGLEAERRCMRRLLNLIGREEQANKREHNG